MSTTIRTSRSLFLLTLLILCGEMLYAQSPELVLSNPQVSLAFDAGDTYCFRRMTTAKGQVVTAPDTKTPWGIELTTGEAVETSAHYLGAKQTGKSCLTFTWSVGTGDSYNVVVRVELPEDSPLPRWSLTANLPQDWVIERITYPRLCIPYQEGMRLIMPVGYGISKALTPGTEALTQYPSGSGTMQFLMVSTKEGTAYFGTEDLDAMAKQYRCVADSTSISLYITTTPSESWIRDGVLKLPWYSVMGYSDAGWEETAINWYRPFTLRTKWGQKHKLDRDIPRWLTENDLWILKQKEDSYPELLQMMLKYGNNSGIHWYHWHHYPFDTRYPDYFPTKPEVPGEFAEASAMGAHILPYINGRIWDPLSQAFQDYDGANNCCTRRDGTFYEEVYYSQVPHYVACPASEGWQAVQKSVIHQIANDLHTEGVYIDQVACAAPFACYSRSHGHAPGEGSWWVDSYRDLYMTARKESLKPGQILMTEECAEPYIDIFDLMLPVNTDRRGTNIPIPLFPIIYGDRAYYTGYCYIGSPIYDGSYLLITAKSLLWGAQLGWVQPHMILDPKAEREADFLRRAQLFRKKHHELFGHGRMLGEWVPTNVPTTDVPKHGMQPVVLGARWLTGEGKECLIVVNRDTRPHSIVLPSGVTKTLSPLTPYYFE